MLDRLELLIWIGPSVLVALAAHWVARASTAAGSRIACRLSGYAAARLLLDRGGLPDAEIAIAPRPAGSNATTVVLAAEVYHGRSLAAVGLAAHEAGHALQDASSRRPRGIRNLAAALAGFGAHFALLLCLLGMLTGENWLVLVGVSLFSLVVAFVVFTLPVEFHANRLAIAQLEAADMLGAEELAEVRIVLRGAALAQLAAPMNLVLGLFAWIAPRRG